MAQKEKVGGVPNAVEASTQAEIEAFNARFMEQVGTDNRTDEDNNREWTTLEKDTILNARIVKARTFDKTEDKFPGKRVYLALDIDGDEVRTTLSGMMGKTAFTNLARITGTELQYEGDDWRSPLADGQLIECDEQVQMLITKVNGYWNTRILRGE